MFSINNVAFGPLANLTPGSVFIAADRGPGVAIRAVHRNGHDAAAVFFHAGHPPRYVLPQGDGLIRPCIEIANSAEVLSTLVGVVTRDQNANAPGNLAICDDALCVLAAFDNGPVWVDLRTGRTVQYKDCWYVTAWQLGIRSADGQFHKLYSSGTTQANT